MVRRDGSRVRCFTRNGYDWADRFPAIVEAAARLNASSFLIDGEAVISREDGTPDFHALRSKRRAHEAVLFAFDLIEHDGDDLRDLPLIKRKRRLKKLLGRAKRRSIQFVEHLIGDGPTIFEHVCRMGLEGIVSKRTDAPYRSGPSKVWVKAKNPASDAVRRERDEEWAIIAPQNRASRSGINDLPKHSITPGPRSSRGRSPPMRDRQRQYARNPARCQRMMVSGRTIATTSRTDGNQR
jgi:bifunctional non-homologous end joining protein LigD